MYTDVTPAITTVDEVLDGVAGVRDQMRLLDRGMVVLAVEWAKHHPVDPYPLDHPGFEGMEDQWVFDQLAGKGCASFDDSAVAEFAIAAGLTEYSGRKLIRESLMLVHFLPRVWARVLAGGLDVWRARSLAGDCFDLTSEAVEFIDRQMSERTARVTLTSRDRIVAEARKRFMPEAEREIEEQAGDRRRVEIYSHEHEQGTIAMFGQLDVPDALALDAALTAGAQALKDAGSDAPLDTRRAWALGDLARASTGHGTLFPLGSSSFDSDSAGAPPLGAWVPAAPAGTVPPEESLRPHWNGKGASPPGVKLFIHLPREIFAPPNTDPPSTAQVGLVEGKGLPGAVPLEPHVIREWFTRPTLAGAFMPAIKARPVLDLDEEINAGGYTPPSRAQEQAVLSHDGCVFPFCIRPAHVCDIDHTTPWKPDGTGGATCTCNLAPLCRTHHRIKTHADNAPETSGEHSKWSYVHLGGHEYYWTGPRGLEFIRTNNGTYNTGSHNGGAPAHSGSAAQPDTASPVDLGDDAHGARTVTLIDRLLSKAAATRGMRGRDYSPLWSMPARKVTSPDDGYDDVDVGHTITFTTRYDRVLGDLEPTVWLDAG